MRVWAVACVAGCLLRMAEPSEAAATSAALRTAPPAAAESGAGVGSVVVRFDGRSSAVTVVEARYPLKLLHAINRHPHVAQHTAALQSALVELPLLPPYVPPVVQVAGYGGGLLSGDRLSVNVRLMEHSSLLLTTPAHGRAYKQQQPAPHSHRGSPTVPSGSSTHSSSSSGHSSTSSGHIGSELRHAFHLGPAALLLFAPSPLSLFARSSLHTSTTVHLHRNSSALLVDVITGGRRSRGEQFGQSLYSNTTTVYFTDGDDQRVPVPAMRDRSVLLGQQHCDEPLTVGRYQARGTVLLLGPHLLPLAVRLFLQCNQRSVKRRARMADPVSGSTECVVSAAWVCGNAPELVPADCVIDSAAVEICLRSGRVSGGCLLRLLSVEVENALQTVGRLLSALDVHMQGVAPWQRV